MISIFLACLSAGTLLVALGGATYLPPIFHGFAIGLAIVLAVASIRLHSLSPHSQP